VIATPRPTSFGTTRVEMRPLRLHLGPPVQNRWIVKGANSNNNRGQVKLCERNSGGLYARSSTANLQSRRIFESKPGPMVSLS